MLNWRSSWRWGWGALVAGVLVLFASVPTALAFCGFYVAQADGSLYNQASQAIIARDGDRTILTMANDYQGELQDFAMVVPVPTLLSEEQVRVGDPEIITRLDRFSAPRLVEYFDRNPCEVRTFEDGLFRRQESVLPQSAAPAPTAAADLGVTVEAEFTVGEYDIVILSAKESKGLETWLRRNNYKLPRGARELLAPYIRQNMKFFVAKVNLEEFAASETQKLRPLMMAFESPKFMLPIRLGMLNANGPQDLLVYLLSPKGQVELTNYRTVKVPSDAEIPEYIKADEEFPSFYKAMFENAYNRQGKNAAFLEYAWDIAKCDPCTSQPPTPEELRKAGVFWLSDPSSNPNGRFWGGAGGQTYITRLHVRYTRDKFPQDLMFQETNNRESFQGRYIIRHPFRGEANCDAATAYRRQTRDRQEKEILTLAQLTDWSPNEIRDRVDLISLNPESQPWWRSIWN
ncbi:MAG: DUF2330 domain-containing protein [Cyanobacteria bacterium J06641_5]